MSTCTNRPAIHHSSRTHPAKSRAVDDGPLSPEALDAALTLRDLADPAAGPHAVQSVVTAVEGTLHARWGIPVRRDPGGRIVPVADNYDALRYTADAATRDRRYTRYV